MSTNILYKINPDRAKPWNDLPDLPIHSDLYKTFEIYEGLIKAKEALARLQGRSVAIPNQGLLINTISLQEAKESSAIENIFTTDDELYKAYSEYGEEKLSGAAKEVINYHEALWSGHEYLQNSRQFDLSYFISMYRIVKQMNDGIRPPFAQVYIKRGGSDAKAHEPIYVPPRGEGIIEAKMNNLIEFLNNDIDFQIDPVLKMIMAHLQYEAIHPFRDGNGRTGRILNVHYLTIKKLIDYPILYLSRYINENKVEYYERISGVTQRGDWKNWILFNLKAVEQTSIHTLSKINDIMTAQNSIKEELNKHNTIKKANFLIQAIFTQPITKVKHLTDQKLYAENTARNYLNKLSELGILEKRNIQGHFYYVNTELYRILQN